MGESVYPRNFRIQLGYGLEDEGALVQSRVRNGQARLVDLLVSEEQKVEVERPWSMLAGHSDTAEAPLGLEETIEQLPRGERRRQLRCSVEEKRLRTDADRLGLAERGDRDDLDPVLGAERGDGRADRRLPVAEVGAKPDEGARHGRVTVTPTVPSSPAGRTSGFRTRTRRPSGAKRRSSSSATAPASASSSANCRESETSLTTPATST